MTAPLSITDKINKLSALRRVYITHPATEPIFAALDRLFWYGSIGADSGGSADCILLTGPSRSGKTALLNYWRQRRPPSTDGDVDHRPILYVEAPHNCTPSALSRAILRSLGVPNLIANRATNDSLLHQIKIQVSSQRVKVIIIDEIQHLIDSSNRKVIYSSAEFLKSILNLGQCSLVLAGIPSASLVVAENIQLESRNRSPLLLRGFDISIQAQKAEFTAIIKAFGEQLPFEMPSDLHLLAPKLARATEGSLGRSIDLIVRACELALDREAKSLEAAHLKEALDLRNGGASSGQLNPFEIEPAMQS